MLPFLDKPFAFFGHSMGAILAYELAINMRQLFGVLPLRLFVSGARAPDLRREEKKISLMDDDELIEELRELNGTPEELLKDRSTMQLLLPLLRADFELLDAYVPKDERPLECPITVFGGLGDLEVSSGEIAAWRRYTQGEFSAHMLPGDHFFINSIAVVSVHKILVQKLLRSYMDRVSVTAEGGSIAQKKKY